MSGCVMHGALRVVRDAKCIDDEAESLARDAFRVIGDAKRVARGALRVVWDAKSIDNEAESLAHDAFRVIGDAESVAHDAPNVSLMAANQHGARQKPACCRQRRAIRT